MTYTLVINPHAAKPRVSKHDSLRDTRGALIRYNAVRGLRLTIQPWVAEADHAIQSGDLLAGMDIVGGWAISCPLEKKLPA